MHWKDIRCFVYLRKPKFYIYFTSALFAKILFQDNIKWDTEQKILLLQVAHRQLHFVLCVGYQLWLRNMEVAGKSVCCCCQSQVQFLACVGVCTTDSTGSLRSYSIQCGVITFFSISDNSDICTSAPHLLWRQYSREGSPENTAN